MSFQFKKNRPLTVIPCPVCVGGVRIDAKTKQERTCVVCNGKGIVKK